MATTDGSSNPALLRAGNAVASTALIFLSCLVFSLIPIQHTILQLLNGPQSIAFTGRDFLICAAVGYAVVLTAFFLTEKSPRTSKALRVVQVFARFVMAPGRTVREGLSQDDKLALRIILLKGFFGPFMTVALMRFCMDAWVNGQAIFEFGIPAGGLRTIFDQYGFWFLMHVILFVDVFFFTIGYLVELPRLDNRIRSVDPTWLGWCAAMVCYPPFNALSGKLLGSPVTDFPQFENTTLHLTLNLALLLLMAVYASASAALGFKASNLTHRGIVARGPYAIVRHPAYLTKNLAWWIGSIPIIAAGFEQSFVQGLAPVLAMAGWSAIYVLRALTEEDHLRRVDGDYAVYAAQVRYRFVPGLI